MAIGRDMRLTSPELCEAAVRGALDAGCDVDEIGLVGTEMLYYAVCEHGYEGGLIVTASHNPEAVQRHEDRAPRRAAAGRRRRHREGARPRARRASSARPRPQGKRGQRDVLQGFAERCLAIVDVERDRAAAGRARRRQRHGRAR